ncbi:DMT family transporter [Endothiovibrio diazotrophicus]
MAWTHLIIAGLFEITWAVGLKYSVGFTRLWPSLFTAATALASFYFLASALRTLPMGTGYAAWTGIGVAGTAIAGMILFDEPREWARLACIGLIITGIVGLKLLSTE